MPRRKTTPVDYSPEIAQDICDQIASGLTLTDVCKQKGMPHRPLVYRWLRKYDEFAAMYEAAREDQADSYADQIRAVIAGSTDKSARSDKVKLWGLTWLASKGRPGRYGERIEHKHDARVKGEIKVSFVTPKSTSDK